MMLPLKLHTITVTNGSLSSLPCPCQAHTEQHLLDSRSLHRLRDAERHQSMDMFGAMKGLLFESYPLKTSHLGQPSRLPGPPSPSQKRLRPPTFSFLGTSSPPATACFSMAAPSFSLLLKRQIRMPTPAPSRRLSRIALAFFSSLTRRPSFNLSRSKRRLLCTNGPATPIPHTKLPECRSILQHSFGSMLAETKESSLGRRERQRLRRMLTRDQCRRRAAI